MSKKFKHRPQAYGILLGGLLLAGPAVAEQVVIKAPDIFNKAKCVACHEVSETRVGPAYMDVANMYEDSGEEIVETLARKVIQGGGGNWGLVPMVENPHVTMEEARRMVRWILGLSAEAVNK